MSREIEARLKLSAVDRTAGAFQSVSGRMKAIDDKAKAVTAASSKIGAATVAMAGRVAAVVAPAVVAGAAKRALTDFAEVDRRITRIGITADASAAAVGNIRSKIVEIGQETATPLDAVTGGLEDLVSQGKSLEDALAFLPAVARTAQASGAEVKDIAATSGALADSLDIVATRMQAAFDVLVAGGKAGKFELKDMSQYLPSLAPAAAAVGMKGEAGLKRLVAMLQIVRNQTGDASSAATNLQNVFQKMESDETAKKFEKFGVDLRKEMAKARKEGKDLSEVFLDLSERALKGDLSKIPQLFGDMQVSAGVRALLSQRDALRKLQAALDGVDGTTIGDLAKVTGDAQSSLDRLSNSWNQFVVSTGKTVAGLGVPKALDALTKAMDERLQALEEAAATPGGMPEVRIRKLVAGGMSPDDAEKLIYADESWPMFRKKGPREQAADQHKADVAALGDMDAARRAVDVAERAGRTTVYGRPSGLAARDRDAAQARLDRARQAANRLFPYEDYGATPGIPDSELAPLRHYMMPQARPRRAGEVGGVLPMPKARPDPFDIPVQLDDASMDSEIARMRARLQSSLDAQPLIIRTRTEAAKAPLDTGRSFKGGDFSGAP
jgi:TP901 family phage tail tape measure protein